jgi:hypothetical protein
MLLWVVKGPREKYGRPDLSQNGHMLQLIDEDYSSVFCISSR